MRQPSFGIHDLGNFVNDYGENMGIKGAFKEEELPVGAFNH